MKTSVHMAKPEHEVAYQDICNLVGKHAAKVSSLELLAIAANMLGKMIALQNQRTVTPKMAMEVVAKNIEFGNETILKNLTVETKGTA